MNKTIYDLELHEHIYVGDNTVIRVAGGWIYIFKSSSVFVPFDNEFQ